VLYSLLQGRHVQLNTIYWLTQPCCN